MVSGLLFQLCFLATFAFSVRSVAVPSKFLSPLTARSLSEHKKTAPPVSKSKSPLSKFEGQPNVPKPKVSLPTKSLITQEEQRKADAVARRSMGFGMGSVIDMGKGGRAAPNQAAGKAQPPKSNGILPNGHTQNIQEKQFKLMDVNNDGLVTLVEVLEMREQLKALLANSVPFEEFDSHLKEQLKTLLRKIEGVGFVEKMRNEFNTVLTLDQYKNQFLTWIERRPQEL